MYDCSSQNIKSKFKISILVVYQDTFMCYMLLLKLNYTEVCWIEPRAV